MRGISREVFGVIALVTLIGDVLAVEATSRVGANVGGVARPLSTVPQEVGMPSSLPEAFRSAGSGTLDRSEWLEEVGQASSSLRIHIFRPSTWEEKGPLRPQGELLNFQSEYGKGRAAMAFNPAFQLAGVSLPLPAARLKTLAKLLGQSLGGDLQAYGQATIGGRTWIWLQHWMPMPQAGKALPFDGSLAWTFVSSEGTQFFTVAFYVLHLRGAPDEELAQQVQRAVPVFTETLTRLRVEQTGLQ